jgi:hypothetical protein
MIYSVDSLEFKNLGSYTNPYIGCEIVVADEHLKRHSIDISGTIAEDFQELITEVVKKFVEENELKYR